MLSVNCVCVSEQTGEGSLSVCQCQLSLKIIPLYSQNLTYISSNSGPNTQPQYSAPQCTAAPPLVNTTLLCPDAMILPHY